VEHKTKPSDGTGAEKEPRIRPWRSRLWEWTDFGEKTLWDWLQLLSALAIPVVLAVAGFWFTAWQGERQQAIEDQRAKVERDIEDHRAQDTALQAYLDQMTELILEKHLRDSKEESELRTLARARTLTVLGRLGPDRKRSVIQFLYESHLIQKGDAIVDLENADLSEADLRLDNLSHADLSHADLTGAKLSDADLSHADLTGATLSDANLAYANLTYANLTYASSIEADLSGADLTGATVSDANLKEADLSGATLLGADLSGATLLEADLRGAELSGARGVTKRKLERSYVKR
jgi:uncharacterized protein YjbI with pentapeptide repeats